MKYTFWIYLIFSGIALYFEHTFWPEVFTLGLFLNFLVISLNDWKMPVLGLKDEGVRHTRMVKETRFKLLGDVIPVGFGTASIGDFLLIIGFAGMVVNERHKFAEIISISAMWIWSFGWSGGFRLWEKVAEEVKDAKKNIPIFLLTFIIGSLFHVKGCSTSELMAATKGDMIPDGIRSVQIKEYHSLGTVTGFQSPSPEFLTRLKAVTKKAEEKRRLLEEKQRKEKERLELKHYIFSIRAVSSDLSQTEFQIQKRHVTMGKTCHIVCARCHDPVKGTDVGPWDRETLPEICQAGQIPADVENILGWDDLGNGYERIAARPGPGRKDLPLKEYKLYWK